MELPIPIMSSIPMMLIRLVSFRAEVKEFTSTGIIRLNTWGRITRTMVRAGRKFRLAAASYWVLLIPCSPPLKASGNEVLINNRKKAKIFIDGLEGTMQELESLDADDIDRIEVLSVPSASYGSELMGGIIHVIRKNRMEHLFKGNLQASRGLR